MLELRALSEWSDGQFWVSPEQHGTITAVFKNQSAWLRPRAISRETNTRLVVDWIPLSVGSVRPTQGRTLAVCQINGGSQSFNTVNLLRQLGRWMRMWTVRGVFVGSLSFRTELTPCSQIPNQSSMPKAWTQYTKEDRLMPSSNRDRLVGTSSSSSLLVHSYLLPSLFPRLIS